MKKYDVIVVGAGPAGITANLFKKANLDCLIIEKMHQVANIKYINN